MAHLKKKGFCLVQKVNKGITGNDQFKKVYKKLSIANMFLHDLSR